MKTSMLCPRTHVAIRRGPIWSIALLSAAVLWPALASGQSTYTPYTFTTIAGSPSIGANDGAGASAHFDQPAAVAVDSAGNTYVADSYNNTIRKITPSGDVTTFAGSPGETGSADGTGSQARFFLPSGIAVDAAGNVYVSDTGNYTIRKITPGGTVSTLAGSPGVRGYTDGTGAAARFYIPIGVTVDDLGNLLVSDSGNNIIRKVTPAGVVTTFASTGILANKGSVDGTGTGANFNGPHNVAIDGSGNTYVADYFNDTIRKITPAGVVTTLAGSPGEGGTADGTGSAARFSLPAGLAVDSSGNLYVADSGNHAIRKVTPAGVVTTLAGSPGTSGSTNGTGTGASFNTPLALAVDGSGNVYVADSYNQLVRKVTAGGVVTTVAGTAGQVGATDGTGTAALFGYPEGIVVDGSGNLFVADTSNATIRKITPAGVVTTFAGAPAVAGSADGTGTAASFSNPNGLTIDGSGNLYVADTGNHTIRKVTSAAAVTTLVGTAGLTGETDGVGGFARFTSPIGVAVDSSGNVIVADIGNNLIRKVTPSGTVTTLAGSIGNQGFANGSVVTARFNSPGGIAVDHQGVVYVADTGNNCIRKISADGVVTNFGGSAVDLSVQFRDGYTNIARFSEPIGVVVDGSGNVLVCDTSNSVIRMISPGGVVSTLVGTATVRGMVNATGAAASFNLPRGLAIDASGTLTVADTGNNAIRRVTPALVVTTLAGSGPAGSIGSTNGPGATARFNGPFDLALDAAGTLYVDDAGNGLIRKIASDGTVSGSASPVVFVHPNGIAVDAAGNLYVADTNTATIQKITPASVVSVVAGTSGTTGSVDGTGAAALFNQPDSVVVDSAGNLYVADTGNSIIRKITSAGVVTTLAGTAGTAGSTDGTGTAARFSNPMGLALDSAGNLYVADTGNSTIRKITPAGVVTTLAGAPGALGDTDGTGSGALFIQPEHLSVDGSGNVYVADTGNNVVRKVTPAGVVTTLGGVPGIVGSLDGTGSNALFNGVTSVAADSAGNIYVADNGNNTIRKGVPAAPGSGGTGAPANPNSGANAGHTTEINLGSAGGTALFLYPTGVAVDSAGNVYVTDASYNTIQKIAPTGVSSQLAGSAGSAGYHDGAGIVALFNQPGGSALDGAGNVYVADTGNATIRKIAADGTTSTLAGSPGTRGNQDGAGTAASFASPAGVAVDGSGNIYVADAFNQTIRKITPAGVVTTLAGSPGVRGEADGSGCAASFNHPAGVAVDASGTVYVADAYNDTIRKITAAGVVSTLAGSAGISGSNDGTGANALFNQPLGVAVDGSGNVYVADTANATIRRITPAGAVTTVAGVAGIAGFADGAATSALFNQPRGLVVDASGNLFVADTGNAAIRKIAAGRVTTIGVAGSADVAPAFTTQPVSQTVGVGAPVTFTVAVSGTPTPTLQWRKNGSIISGATSASYTITSVAGTDAGFYSASATNVAGTASSDFASLSIDLTKPSSSGGGGGAIGAWFVGALVLLGAARWMSRRS